MISFASLSAVAHRPLQQLPEGISSRLLWRCDPDNGMAREPFSRPRPSQELREGGKLEEPDERDHPPYPSKIDDRARRRGCVGTLGAARAARKPCVCVQPGGARPTRRTLDVASSSATATDVTIAGEPVGSDYWAKLGTSMAGLHHRGRIQLEPNSLSDYAGRGCANRSIRSSASSSTLNFGENMVDLCRARGKIYGVALGLNSFSLFFDRTVFEQAGMKPPTHGTTWKQFADMAVDLTKAANRPNYWAAPYGGQHHYVFDVWLRQRGKVLFAGMPSAASRSTTPRSGSRIGKTCASATPPSRPASRRSTRTRSSNSLALGEIRDGVHLFEPSSSDTLLYEKNKLGITMVPNSGPGEDPVTITGRLMIWSIGATTKNAEKAAAFISFFVNDLEAGKILAVERGVPMSSKVREVILPRT